jgi:glycopeptide antibiotics resistance protein
MIGRLRLSQENGTMDKSKSGENRKKILVAAILIPIALLHFVTGSRYQGPYPSFVNGYLLDILIPLGFYLLLCLVEVPILNSWLVKGILVFSAALAAEFAQWMGMPFLGQVYDPLDILMYAIGVLLAVMLDLLVFPKLFHFWNPNLISE